MEHKWKSQRAGGHPAMAESYEMVTYCENCGGEYPGDPAEFPERQYPCPDEDPGEKKKDLIADYPRDRPTARDVASQIAEFYSLPGNSVGGLLHCVLDDGNLSPAIIETCREQALAAGDAAATKLAEALLRITPTQRRRAIALSRLAG